METITLCNLEAIVKEQMMDERPELFKQGIELTMQDRVFDNIDEVIQTITSSMWDDFGSTLYQIDSDEDVEPF